MRRTLICAALLVFCLAGYALADQAKLATVVRHDVPSFVGYVPTEIIVQFKQISARSAQVSALT